MITIYNIRPKGFNVGNDAIYVAMQRYIYHAFKGLVNIITVPATSRYESHGIAGLTSKTVHEINQHGHGVIVGGGNLYENGELDVDLTALKSLNVPLMLFSISRGRIYNREDKLVDRTDVMGDSLMKVLGEKADINLARDQATYDYFKTLGCNNVILGGCPTIFLDRIAKQIPNVENIDKQYNQTVIISIRNPSLINVSLTRQSKVRDDIVRTILFFKENTNFDIKLLCHDIRDVAFASTIDEVEYIYTGDVFTYLSILQSCKLVISYRLHSFLPALSFGTPTIKISYDERALSLIDTLGMSEWNINMVESDNVVKDIIDRYNRIDTLERIKQETNLIWSDLDKIMSKAFEDFAKKVVSS
jgi:polysaccharide pyruvyl transferase WcaK-like protein